MNIKLVIADSDSDYAQRLFDAVSKNPGFTISLFTNKEAMVKSLLSKKYDVLLMDKSMVDTVSKNVPVSVMLVDPDDVEGVDQFLNYNKINKYQRVSEIVRMLMGMYAEVTPNVNMYSTKTVKTIAVYSPIGGSGKTTIAVALAMSLVRLGQRSIYLNMEEYASSQMFFGGSDGKGLSELFGKLSSGINFSAKLQSLLHTVEGVSFFNSFDNPRDIFDVTAEDVNHLLNVLSDVGLCDVVVVDMSSSMSSVNKAIMERADKIMLVSVDGAIAEHKLSILTNQPDFMDMFEDKLRLVLNKQSGRLTNSPIPVGASVDQINQLAPLEVSKQIAVGNYLNVAEYLQ